MKSRFEFKDRRVNGDRRSFMDRRGYAPRRTTETHPRYPLLEEFYMGHMDDSSTTCTDYNENCQFLACFRECDR